MVEREREIWSSNIRHKNERSNNDTSTRQCHYLLPVTKTVLMLPFPFTLTV